MKDCQQARGKLSASEGNTGKNIGLPRLGTVFAVFLCAARALLHTLDVALVGRRLRFLRGLLADELFGLLAETGQGGDIPIRIDIPSRPHYDALWELEDIFGRQAVSPRTRVPLAVAIAVDDAAQEIFALAEIVELGAMVCRPHSVGHPPRTVK